MSLPSYCNSSLSKVFFGVFLSFFFFLIPFQQYLGVLKVLVSLRTLSRPIHKAQVHFCSHPLGKHAIADPQPRESMRACSHSSLLNCELQDLRAALLLG